MGNDGGTIAKRQDILAVHEKEKSVNDIIDSQHDVCAISSLPLEDEQVVGDWKGDMYIKEKVILKILEDKKKKQLEKEDKCKDIKGLNKREVGTSKCGIEEAAGADFPSSLGDIIDLKLKFANHKIVCPISGELNLCYLRSCGCVLSFKLLQDLKSKSVDSSTCPSCNTKFVYDYDIVKQNDPTWNSKQLQKLKSMNLNHAKKPLKKSKRKVNQDDNDKFKRRKPQSLS